MARMGDIAKWLTELERLTRPFPDETRAALEARWAELPAHIRTDGQTLGRMAVGCEGTHGVFPRCNFSCSPCYHSVDANKVRIDGAHTVREIDRQFAYLRKIKGPHAHAQLIGGEVSLLEPDDHAAALEVMRKHGREPMSFTHGDIDYDYLKQLALGPDGRARFKRLSFAAHFDTTMVGRRGLKRTDSEEDLNPYRQRFCDLFHRLRREHGIRFFIAHNVTVTPKNVMQIPQIIKDCHSMGFGMFSFQPAAFVGNERRWKEDYSVLDPDVIWSKIEEGAGAKLPYKIFQTGDFRCNRTAFGFYVGNKWYPVLDEDSDSDLSVRDEFFRYLGGVHWSAPLPLLLTRLTRAAIAQPHLIRVTLGWLNRTVHRIGGWRKAIRALASKQVIPVTFVMHRFMDAEDVRPAWDMLKKGVMSDDIVIRETQERLQSCFYGMAHPESDEIVPACVQHSVLDPGENATLAQLLPLPHVRKVSAEQSLPSSGVREP